MGDYRLSRMHAGVGAALNLSIDYEAPWSRDGQGTVTVVVTETTPGASDGLTGDSQPILIVWGGPTEPLARVALRDRLVARGWEPFTA